MSPSNLVARRRLLIGASLVVAIIGPASSFGANRTHAALALVSPVARLDGAGVLLNAQDLLRPLPPLPTLTPAPPAPPLHEPALSQQPTDHNLPPVSAEVPPLFKAPDQDKPDAAPLSTQSGLMNNLPAWSTPDTKNALPNPSGLSKTIDQSSLSAIKVDNSAGLSVDILPAEEVAIGSRVSFRIRTKRSGYLILVDVDVNGKIGQIYPNTRSLMSVERQNSNFIRPDKSFIVPSPSDPNAGLEYIAGPPSGRGMVVAMLSDRPVQLVDLPDMPEDISGQPAALARLTKTVSELLIPEADSGRLQSAHWSFNAKFYSIR